MHKWSDDPVTNRSMFAGFDEPSTSFNHETSLDSFNASKDDSVESCTEDKNDTSVSKPTFKSMQQAKKRLQAYSTSKPLNRSCSKEEKAEDADKPDKTSPRKSKKTLYSLDKVVQEIEEIKQKEAKVAQEEQKKIDEIMSIAFKTIAMQEVYRQRSRSPSSDQEKRFKKREIKCRNYRRSDSLKRRSLTPENYSKRSGKMLYPKNWTQYKQQGLTVVKDGELRSKLFPRMKYSTHELVTKLLTFDGPSPLIESFKCMSVDEKIENIPTSFLRITRSKPTLTYSINNRKNKDSFLRRKQLFNFIPRERRAFIEKLINSASSRSQFQSRTLTSRPWYSKSWKRSVDAECKILENSVGLSFLQTYSDEEEENDSEEIIHDITNKDETILEASSTKETTFEAQAEEIQCSNTKPEKEEKATLTPEEKPKTMVENYKEEEICNIKVPKEDSLEKKKKHGEKMKIGELKNNDLLEEAKKKQKSEVNETKRAIRVLEEELERRKSLKIEEEEKETKKVKKKKSKRKEDISDSDSEDEDKSKKCTKKKKKKTKVKKKKYSDEGEDTASDNEKPKKTKKKSKYKKEKRKKKKVKSKKSGLSSKEHKAKKKEIENEDGSNEGSKKEKCENKDIEPPGTEDTKKSKKKVREKRKEIAEEGEIEKKKIKEKEKRKKKKKTKRSYSSSESGAEESDGDRKSKSHMLSNNLEAEKNNKEEFVMLEKESKKSSEKILSDKKHKESKKLHAEEIIFSPVETTKRKKDTDVDKHKPRDEVKEKPEVGHERTHSRHSRKSETDNENEDVQKKNGHQREKDIFKGSRHTQKETRHKVEPNRVKQEPDWEQLRHKRSKYRYDFKESLSENFEDFPPLEKDLILLEEKSEATRTSKEDSKCEVGTPDTEEYRENWEKDPYPIWESEDEAPSKVREKLNTSWESDEEIFERRERAVESSKPFRDTFDLEIPLNIKPFKRRDIIDPDKELELLKRQSYSLSEERRKLEIEKIRVKELELKVIKEVESKGKEEKVLKRRRSSEKETRDTDKKVPTKKDSPEKEVVTPKKGRWDKREVSSISHVKKEEVQDEDSLTNVSSTSAVLENEYEEFMKALTSSPKKSQAKNKPSKDENTSSPCIAIPSRAQSMTNPEETQKPDVQIVSKSSNNSNQQILVPPLPQIVTILPKDIPLIPMPLPKEVKPVPVPSPQIEIDKIPKPLINLSLSASITLDIAPKFTAAPVGSPSTSVNSLQAVITQSPSLENLEKITEVRKNVEIETIAPPLEDSSLEEIKSQICESDEKRLMDKPFVFTSMVLPSKRSLLNNSNLNFCDSDDEEKTKPLKKLEEMQTESPEALVDNQKPVEEEKKPEPEPEKPKETNNQEKKPEKKLTRRSRSPLEKDSRKKRSPERHTRRDSSPRRSGGKREPSPRRRGRESPPRRRGYSPNRHSPRRRVSPRRRSPGKRRYSPRRSISPKRRRSSISPRRKQSPRRSPSPKFRPASPRTIKSKSPERSSTSYKSSLERSVTVSTKSKSPTTINSPLEGLKKSVADSTISDDLLPQPSMNAEEYTQSPLPQFYDRGGKSIDSPKREPLDVRISQVLGLTEPQPVKEEPRPIPTTYSTYNYAQFPQQFNKVLEPKSNVIPVQHNFGKSVAQQAKSSFLQVGNMVQILPREDVAVISQVPKKVTPKPPAVSPVVRPVEKSQIVQVGNMLQIVPTELPPEPILPPKPKKEEPKLPTPPPMPPVVQEKPSAESAMRLKVAERREEREKRRLEREKRRKEKEKRKKEKEKQRQIKLKQRTENMIKKALELEAAGLEEEPEPIPTETPAQWPPFSLTILSTPLKEVGRSILVRAGSKTDSPRMERRKIVQFADGVRPGEGTSPSGGEELSSPPPRKKLPKEKRYKKMKMQKKNKNQKKKKVKVKIIKKHAEQEQSDEEEDILPPPSPPPGSPPPHVFPPRMKPVAQPQINNVQQPYLPAVVSVQQADQQQIYRQAQLNLVMHPHHHHHPHHGPPPPPPHHHVPPPPPHHHHHGPPLPPGPPHFHHGPPPPPPHHHPPPPPPGPHHHHGPPPPFHR